MKKFRFIEISFDHIPEKLFVAIEELYFKYTFVLNGYYLFKNSKGEEFEGVLPYKRSTVDVKIGEMEIQHKFEDIKHAAIAKFQTKYDGSLDNKLNQPQFNYYDEINQFSPYGFKDAIYDDICVTIVSPELKERFKKMKGSFNEDIP